jgi:hypothetical protein
VKQNSIKKKTGRSKTEYSILKEYAQFEKSEIYKVFEEIYGDEINLTFGWKWDSGFSDYVIGNVMFSMMYEECMYKYEVEAPEELKDVVYRSRSIDWHDIAQAISAIAYSVACLFPDSAYTNWYKKEAKKRNSNTKTDDMEHKPNRGRSQDRKKVAGGQDHEVQYEKEKMGVSGKQVKDAVKSEGNSRKKVEKKLSK